MEKLRVIVVANLLGIGVSTVYKMLKMHRAELGEEAGKDSAGQWVTPAGVEKLRTIGGIPANSTAEKHIDSQSLRSPDESMRELVASLAETNRVLRSLVESQAEERRRSDHLIAGLLQEIRETRRDSVRLALAPPPVSTFAKTTASDRHSMQKEEIPDPLPAGLKGQIIAFFQPWRLRKAA